jgi:hypothetical protein
MLSSVVFLGKLTSFLYNLTSLGRTVYTTLYTKLALVEYYIKVRITYFLTINMVYYVSL